MDIKYIKVLLGFWTDTMSRGVDLFNEVPWVSVGQRALGLSAIKVGGSKKILPLSPAQVHPVRAWPSSKIFY